MQKSSARSTPVPATDAEWPDPFAWPRTPTPHFVQVPFDFERIEKEGDALCE
jgi:hypothetical protein